MPASHGLMHSQPVSQQDAPRTHSLPVDGLSNTYQKQPVISLHVPLGTYEQYAPRFGFAVHGVQVVEELVGGTPVVLVSQYKTVSAPMFPDPHVNEGVPWHPQLSPLPTGQSPSEYCHSKLPPPRSTQVYVQFPVHGGAVDELLLDDVGGCVEVDVGSEQLD